MENQSITPVGGVVWVTGFPNSGKTGFSLTVPGYLPPDIIFVDMDGKTAAMAVSLKQQGHGFFAYLDALKASFGKKPIEMLPIVEKFLDDAIAAYAQEHKDDGKKPIITFDNWSPFMEDALRDKAMTMLKQISGLSDGQMKIGQMTWNATYQFYASWVQKYSAMAQIFFVITHVKNDTVGQGTKVPGKYVAKGQRPLDELATMKIWFNQSSAYNGAPVGITFKNPMLLQITPTGAQIPCVLPPAMRPCTWQVIYRLFENPAGLRGFTDDEMLLPAERNLLDGEMSPEMKEVYRLAMELDKVRKPNGDDIGNSLAESVQQYKSVNPQASPVDVLSVIRVDFPSATLPDIIKYMQ